MNDELAAIAGKHEQLVGILQEKYGVANEEAKRQIDEFKNIIANLKKTNATLARLQRGKNRTVKKSGRSMTTARSTKKRKRS